MEGSFKCDNVCKCYTPEMICDREKDCIDGTDERNCTCIVKGEEIPVCCLSLAVCSLLKKYMREEWIAKMIECYAKHKLS